MNIQKKVLLYFFITTLVAINTWSIHRITQAYRPQLDVKGVQVKATLPISSRPISLTPISTPNKYTFSVSSITPTKNPGPTTNNTPDTTNKSSPTQSTDTPLTNPSSSNNSINTNSVLTDQESSFPSPTSQPVTPTSTIHQEETSTPTPTTQPTFVQSDNGTTVVRDSNTEVENITIQRPTISAPVGAYVEAQACPKDQTCQ